MAKEQRSIEATIAALFAAERKARRYHDQLTLRTDEERDEIIGEVRNAIAEAAALDDSEEASLRLVCLARLLGELEGGDVVDALIDVLDVEHPEARNEAGEQLQGLAFERFKEVALGIERALERLGTGSPALVELPYILVEFPDVGAPVLLGKFLEHPDVDAVAAAIEALVEVGDPSAVKLLLPLQGDERTTTVGDDEQLQAEVSLGELVIEAIELLRQPEE